MVVGKVDLYMIETKPKQVSAFSKDLILLLIDQINDIVVQVEDEWIYSIDSHWRHTSTWVQGAVVFLS
jgi:hypothetical protein